MKRVIANTGETIEVSGTTVIDGVQVEVTLTINTVQLIHKLGDKAAHNRGRKSTVAWGYVKAVADKAGNQAVREAVAVRRQKSKDRMAADIAASKARREADGDVSW